MVIPILTAYMGSANPKSSEALHWAAMEKDKITAVGVVKQSFKEHNFSVALLWHCCAKETP